MADEQAQANNEKQLMLQKIYIKDLSFESPKAPEVFMTEGQANTQLNIGSGNRQLDADNIEVTLTLTIESKDTGSEDTLFLIEVVQAGVFTVKGYSDQEKAMLLGSFCPGTLFPFAREAVADIVAKGGFPQLLLQPINFDALYAQAVQQRQMQAQTEGGQPIQVQMPGGGQAEVPAAGGEQAGAEAGDASSKGGGDTH
jgi:preprotein translocase subunit SecB